VPLEANDLVARNVAALADTPKGQEGRPSKSLTLDQAVAVAPMPANCRGAGDVGSDCDQRTKRSRAQHRQQSGSGSPTQVTSGPENPLPRAVPHQPGFGISFLQHRTGPTHVLHSRPISPCT
jgi:hypothetical protein